MKKTITPPEKHTALFALRNNLSLSDQRIFLYLLKSAFRHNKGLTSAKKDILELYATFELGQRLNKDINGSKNNPPWFSKGRKSKYIIILVCLLKL